jgi:hypothetical protein
MEKVHKHYTSYYGDRGSVPGRYRKYLWWKKMSYYGRILHETSVFVTIQPTVSAIVNHYHSANQWLKSCVYLLSHFQMNQSHAIASFVLGGLSQGLQFLTLQFITYKRNVSLSLQASAAM